MTPKFREEIVSVIRVTQDKVPYSTLVLSDQMASDWITKGGVMPVLYEHNISSVGFSLTLHLKDVGGHIAVSFVTDPPVHSPHEIDFKWNEHDRKSIHLLMDGIDSVIHMVQSIK